VNHLEHLITSLADGLPEGLGDAEDGIRVESTTVDMTVPVETYVDQRGSVRASLPRGRLATGWDPIHSRLVLAFERREREPPSGRGGEP
jgi:hypothetical protein